MLNTLKRIREERAEDDRGFTLIELLVVVVIIGILVAIAIPLYLSYRKGAENKSIQSDIRNTVPTVEQWLGDNPGGSIPSVSGTSSSPLTVATGYTSNVSSGNTIWLKAGSAGQYFVCGTNTDSGAYYGYSNNTATGFTAGQVSTITHAVATSNCGAP